MSSAIDQARALIDQAQTALNAALSHLKAYSTSTGRVSGSKLDEKQSLTNYLMLILEEW